MACSTRWRISSIQNPGRSRSPFRRTSSSRDRPYHQPMRAKPSDTKLINLFLDMLAAEQGAGDNTLQAYRRDPTDFSEFLGRAGQTFAGADTQSMRDYLADLD